MKCPKAEIFSVYKLIKYLVSPHQIPPLTSFSQDSLMEDLIIHSAILFDDQAGPRSPPLPPTPAGEPVPRFAYGSKTTKVMSPTQPITSTVQSSPQDFTPRLPPRPVNSIHPSLRANPATPTAKGSMELRSPSIHNDELPSEGHSPPSPPAASTAIEAKLEQRTQSDAVPTLFPKSTSPGSVQPDDIQSTTDDPFITETDR
jgi:hypothetical protein